jgi:hypothetical protein
MPKHRDIEALIRATLKPPPKPKRRLHLGFANQHEEQLFRALAVSHPKGVQIDDAEWQLYAEEHVKLGTFSCVKNGHAVYRLARYGVERAVEAKLVRGDKWTRRKFHCSFIA